MDYAIEVKNIYKFFEKGKKDKNLVFRDAITGLLATPYRLLSGKITERTYHHALDGISFKVKKGEVLGIVGKNGAGKSTLLKVLSRITEPTKGEVSFRGKIGSLIEVGTGFHQELTGRENVYLNGALLGMSRREVDFKFREIVEFSEVGNFLDIPVKRYSSGMYVRLAFAVAAHLDTDILLVDEVLSVGDVEFQQKSLGKVKDIASSGRTVIFVSHNMSVISQLCTRCLVLSDGKIEFDGNPNKAIAKYLASEYEYFGMRVIKKNADKIMQIRKVMISNEGKRPSGILDTGERIRVSIEYDVNKKISNVVVYAAISFVEGTVLLKTTDAGKKQKKKNKAKYLAYFILPQYLINVGRYVLSAGCEVPDKSRSGREVFDQIDAFQFECVDKSGKLDDFGSGVLAPKYRWVTKMNR